MNRREFLTGVAGLAVVGKGALEAQPAATAAPAMPVIDTHIHLFDPFRPGSCPYPNPRAKVMYKTSLPSRYRPIAEPLGIVGAIEIECSAWVLDNQWVLDVAQKEDIMVGTVGHLTPGTPEFRYDLDTFQRNPLFRGIRYGLGRPADPALESPKFYSDLQALADADLVMDTANPNVTLLANVVRVSDRVPSLRIVIDHLPQMVPPPAGPQRDSYEASLRAIRERPQIYVKVSEVLRNARADNPPAEPNDPTIRTDTDFYRPRLDEILGVFGVDRVLYGSDWPNGDQWLPVPVGFKIVQEYFNGLGREAAEKYFWRNSIKAYKWVRRTAAQPQA
jgi:L-fuconolactonase